MWYSTFSYSHCTSESPPFFCVPIALNRLSILRGSERWLLEGVFTCRNSKNGFGMPSLDLQRWLSPLQKWLKQLRSYLFRSSQPNKIQRYVYMFNTNHSLAFFITFMYCLSCLLTSIYLYYALGNTVSELGLDQLSKELDPLGGPQSKTLFSMMIPEVVEAVTKKQIRSVVIFGIEVINLSWPIRHHHHIAKVY